MKTMHKAYIFLMIICTFLSANNDSNFFEVTGKFLADNVKDGKVNYAALKKNPAELDRLTKSIAEFDLSALNAAETKAFWLNAYNILVIKGVVTHLPINSPLDVQGFFKTITYPAAGENLTLDDIEHKKIRPVYGDARIHFALVCAALGCPPIKPFAYLPAKLDEQLDNSTIEILNDDTFIIVDEKTKKVAVSEIFNWFRGDFENDGVTILEYINRYRKSEIPGNYELSFNPYNWQLNSL